MINFKIRFEKVFFSGHAQKVCLNQLHAKLICKIHERNQVSSTETLKFRPLKL